MSNPTIGQDPWGADLNDDLDAIKASIAAIALDAKAFGVVADGAHNDGDAMQDAVDFCVANSVSLKLPGGTILMRTAAGAVKRLVIDMDGAAGSFHMFGEGIDASTLKWNDDIGAGNCAINVINSGTDAFPDFERFSIEGKYQGRCDPNASATPPSGGYGLRIPNRSNYRSIYSSGFWAGFVIDGEDSGSGSTENTDHSDLTFLQAEECVYGFWVTGNGRKARDYNFTRCFPSRNQRAGIGIDENAELTDCTFLNCHFNTSPFPFWKVGATPSNTAFLSNILFLRCKFEGPGNGFFWTDATDGSGDMQRLTGFVELHGIETNGQVTGGGGSIDDHGLGDTNHTWRPWAATSITRNGSGTVSAVFAALPAPLQIGDALVVYVSDNHALNSSYNNGDPTGGFTVKNISGTGPYTVQWEQSGGALGPVAGTCGPCVGMRAGSFVNSDLIISVLSDPTTVNAAPELNFDLDSADEVTLTTFGERVPKFRFSGGGLNGGKVNVLWRRGTSEAYLAKATGTFAAGKQLECAANGGVKLSTVTPGVPYAGTALQPGATTISVVGAGTLQVVSLIYVFVMRSGRNSTFSFGGANQFGPGATYFTDPGSNATLCEDPAHPGDVMACPFTAGVTYRVIGRSLAAGSGGFINMFQRDPYTVKL